MSLIAVPALRVQNPAEISVSHQGNKPATKVSWRTFIVAALGVTIAAAVVGVALGHNLGGSDTPVGGGGVAGNQKVDLSNPKAAVETLGGPNDDQAAIDRARSILSALPRGTEAVAIASPVVAEAGDLRLEQTRYELRVPGESPRPFIIERQYVRDGKDWLQLSVYVVGVP